MNQLKSVEQRSLDAVGKSVGFVIKTNEQNLKAAELVKGIQLLKKEVCDTFDPIITKAHATHKEACAKKAKFYVPLKNAEIDYKNKMIAFDDIMETERKNEEDRLRREADKKTEALKEKAVEALKKGDEKKADKFTQKAAEVFTPAVAPKHEKPESASFVIYYEAQIINRHVIPRKMNGIELMIPDVRAIDKLVNVSKGTIKIPGVQVIQRKRMTSRTA